GLGCAGTALVLRMTPVRAITNLDVMQVAPIFVYPSKDKDDLHTPNTMHRLRREYPRRTDSCQFSLCRLRLSLRSSLPLERGGQHREYCGVSSEPVGSTLAVAGAADVFAGDRPVGRVAVP